MDRIRKHLVPKRRVADRLRRLGLSVRLVSTEEGYDMLVNERLRVALRVAFPRWQKHLVTVGGRRYTYRYRSWRFNFHHHGEFGKKYADVFVCLAMEPRAPARERDFIIPWEHISGMTFSLHGSRKEYQGQYAPHIGNWSMIGRRATEQEA